MELKDRIDWVAYEEMLRKALSEGMDREQEGQIDAEVRSDELRNIEDELNLLTSGNRQGVVDKYRNELGDDIDEYFEGFFKDK